MVFAGDGFSLILWGTLEHRLYLKVSPPGVEEADLWHPHFSQLLPEDCPEGSGGWVDIFSQLRWCHSAKDNAPEKGSAVTCQPPVPIAEERVHQPVEGRGHIGWHSDLSQTLILGMDERQIYHLPTSPGEGRHKTPEQYFQALIGPFCSWIIGGVIQIVASSLSIAHSVWNDIAPPELTWLLFFQSTSYCHSVVDVGLSACPIPLLVSGLHSEH